MSQELKIINNQKILEKDFKIYGSIENPLFLAKDVAEWIEHSNASKMVLNVDEDEKTKKITPITNSYNGTIENQECLFLTEYGLYEVLMQSRKPIAKAFKKEVKNILKQLRTKGVVITEKATEEAIDFEKKYGTYRIRKTFTNSNNLRADYEEFKDLSKAEWKAKRLSGQDRIKLHNIIFDAISKRLQNNITELKGSEMLAMQELLTDIKSDTLKLCNNVNGGIKRGQTQEIGKLKAELESLKPISFEDMVKVDNYAISKNDLHEPSIHSITGEVMIRNTNEYNGWKWYFQKAMDKANIKELFSHIDWNEPVEISYGVTCHEQNDISNFIDALQDVLKEYFNCDDKKFLIGTQLIVGIEPVKMKRKTWLYFRNVNENDYIVKNGVVA